MDSSQISIPQPTQFYGESGSDFAVLDLITGEQRIIAQSRRIGGSKSYTYALIPTGGLFGTVDLDAVYFDADMNAHEKPKMLSPHTYHGSVFYQGNVFVIGGSNYDKGYSNKFEVFSMTHNKWKSLPPCPVVTCNTVPIVLEATAKFIVIGGFTGDEVNVYDLKTKNWLSLTVKLPTIGFFIPTFTISAFNTSVFYVNRGHLFCLNSITFTIKRLRKTQGEIQSFGGPTCWHNGVLYCLEMQRQIVTMQLPLLWEISKLTLWVLDAKWALRNVLKREVVKYLN
jgi:hypothetical protein